MMHAAGGAMSVRERSDARAVLAFSAMPDAVGNTGQRASATTGHENARCRAVRRAA